MFYRSLFLRPQPIHKLHIFEEVYAEFEIGKVGTHGVVSIGGFLPSLHKLASSEMRIAEG